MNPHNQASSSTSCAVCGDRHHGQHFGVLACRACSSFWRRSLVERKVYKCRANNSCDIGKAGMRNACRACRLERCRRAGMKGEVPSASIHSPEDSYSPNYIEKPTPVFAVDFQKTTNEMERLAVNYRNFCSAQRSLFIVENPRSIFSTPQYKPLRKKEHERMERGSIALLHTMISDSSPSYRQMPKEIKVQIMRQFSMPFMYLHRCFVSYGVFPDIDDSRVCVHYGYYLAEENLREFFRDAVDNMDEHEKFAKPIIRKTVQTTNFFRQLQIREIEMVAMAAILFHYVLEDLNLVTEERLAVIDNVNNELHYDIANVYGISSTGARLGRLHGLIHQITIRSMELKESMVVARIFLMDMHSDIWDDLQLPEDNVDQISTPVASVCQ